MSDPVLLIGIPSEPPLAMLARALTAAGAEMVVFNQRSVASTHAELTLSDAAIGGTLTFRSETFPLEMFGGVYTRQIDHRILPEVAGADPASGLHAHADLLHEIVDAFCALTPARVVNRAVPGMSNASKPYQAQLIARRFAIPETLVTTAPDAALGFLALHGRIVFKSVSGSRSIVRAFAAEDLGRLETLAHCPVQFQQHIDGIDVRVHTLADGTVIATLIESDADDWRYARERPARMHPWVLPDDLSERCLLLAGDLGLDFAGIDLRISPEGEAYCFEVNPSPAYSAFEQATGQPIAAALARFLMG